MVMLRDSAESSNEAFRKAVELLGGQARAASVLKRSQSAISKRLAKGEAIWPDCVIKVESMTGISRIELAPDLYPTEPPKPAPLPGGTPAERSHSSAGVPESQKGLQP